MRRRILSLLAALVAALTMLAVPQGSAHAYTTNPTNACVDRSGVRFCASVELNREKTKVAGKAVAFNIPGGANWTVRVTSIALREVNTACKFRWDYGGVRPIPYPILASAGTAWRTKVPGRAYRTVVTFKATRPGATMWTTVRSKIPSSIC